MHMEPECKQESNVNIVDILIASLHFVYWECKFVSKFLFWNKNEKILSKVSRFNKRPQHLLEEIR